MKSIEIDFETARELLPVMESTLQRAELDQADMAQRVTRLRTTIQELRVKLTGGELPLIGGPFRKRLSKGQAEEMVFNLFEGLPGGTVLTMAQIKSKTGLKHATVFRTLNDPTRNKGRFIKDGDGWKAAERRLVIKLRT